MEGRGRERQGHDDPAQEDHRPVDGLRVPARRSTSRLSFQNFHCRVLDTESLVAGGFVRSNPFLPETERIHGARTTNHEAPQWMEQNSGGIEGSWRLDRAVDAEGNELRLAFADERAFRAFYDRTLPRVLRTWSAGAAAIETLPRS